MIRRNVLYQTIPPHGNSLQAAVVVLGNNELRLEPRMEFQVADLDQAGVVRRRPVPTCPTR